MAAVLYVAGAPHSGSTLIASLLGQVSGFFAAAETRLLWRNLERRRCGCGSLAVECQIWAHAIRHVRDVTGATPRDVVALQERTTRLQHLPATLRRADETSGPLADYRKVLTALYAGLQEVTRADVIVDSSKNPSEALLLRDSDCTDAHVVHLVRDPRAVVYSWHRAQARTATQPKYKDNTRTAARWAGLNVAAHVVTSRYDGARTSLVRYEDVVRDPQRVLVALAQSVAQEDVDLRWLDGRGPVPVSRHMIGGNGLRETKGPIRVASDDRWRAALRARDLMAINPVTFPLAHRYGYAWRPAPG